MRYWHTIVALLVTLGAGLLAAEYAATRQPMMLYALAAVMLTAWLPTVSAALLAWRNHHLEQLVVQLRYEIGRKR